MTTSIHQRWAVDQFAGALRRGNAALFVGSGASIAAGFNAWRDLLRAPAERLGLNVDEELDNLPDLAQWYVNSNGGNRSDLHQRIADAFVKRAQLSEIHRVLAQLPIDVIWTTNYDTLIEAALSDRVVDVKVTDASLATDILGAETTVFKPHGSVSEAGVRDIVICSDDFREFPHTRPGMRAVLLNHFMSRVFLFVGYSFRDPNVRHVLEDAKSVLRENVRQHFFIDRREQDEGLRLRQELWSSDMRRFGVETILVDDYASVPELLKTVLMETLKDKVFVTGSHADLSSELKQFAFDLGGLLAKRGIQLVYAQSEGVSKANAFGFVDALVATQQDFLRDRIELYPYLYNPDRKLLTPHQERPDPTAVDTLKRAMLRKVSTCVALAGGVGTDHELGVARALQRRVIPVGRFGGAAEAFLQSGLAYLRGYLPQEDIDTLRGQDVTPDKVVEIVMRAAGGTP